MNYWVLVIGGLNLWWGLHTHVGSLDAFNLSVAALCFATAVVYKV